MKQYDDEPICTDIYRGVAGGRPPTEEVLNFTYKGREFFCNVGKGESGSTEVFLKVPFGESLKVGSIVRKSFSVFAAYSSSSARKEEFSFLTSAFQAVCRWHKP